MILIERKLIDGNDAAVFLLEFPLPFILYHWMDNGAMGWLVWQGKDIYRLKDHESALENFLQREPVENTTTDPPLSRVHTCSRESG